MLYPLKKFNSSLFRLSPQKIIRGFDELASTLQKECLPSAIWLRLDKEVPKLLNWECKVIIRTY